MTTRTTQNHRAGKVVPSKQLTLRDRLSRLSHTQACQLLGPQSARLIRQNANVWEFQIPEDIYLGDDLFRLSFPGATTQSGLPLTVTITLMAESRKRLHLHCNQCERMCEHLGAAMSLILEDKFRLGLSAPPKERAPIESLSESELVERAVAERAERARTEKMTVKSLDSARPWSDYTVTNRLSGRTYRVALRGLNPGDSYCSCPDFRTNTLGTCKHIIRVATLVRRRFKSTQLSRPARPRELALHLHYADSVTLRFLVPAKLDTEVADCIAPLVDRAIDDIPKLMKRLAGLQKLGQEVTVYPDAEEFIQRRLSQHRLHELTSAIRRDPQSHPLRTTLLHVPLLPYQLDGIAFAAGAGRAILADDMGLGKTIQGVGIAEFLAREAEVRKVLVVCPASLKSQWRSEIRRFCDRDVQLVSGAVAERSVQYENDCFFTICNYEQVLRDLLSVERVTWDLIILDEGQRIKNWESKTSRTIKMLRSRFAVVLTGTPLENRLDDLYSIAQFVDDRCLGPGFRFFNRHRLVDEKGKTLGYKNLGELREALRPLLLRRTRDSVKLELPPRTMEILRISPSDEQKAMHDGHMQTVASITSKKFLTEMDLLRLQKALLMCRMSADSTYLVDKVKPGYSTKLSQLDELLEQLFDEPDRKAVLFSEWTTMLDLIEPLLAKHKLPFVRLDGKVPQQKRQELMYRFQTDPECKLFLSTNAGSTGLNLQAANTVINVDLPWNPAVLEQRIARAHRMGQDQPVQVYVLVTENTLEENLLATLAAKKDLALAALDIESSVDQVDLVTGIEELRNRLEILLGARPEAPRDTKVDDESGPEEISVSEAHRERVAAAGGELLGVAFKFLGELTSLQPATPPPSELVDQLHTGLKACTSETESGQPQLTVTLPSRDALQQLAQTLARLLVTGTPQSADESINVSNLARF